MRTKRVMSEYHQVRVDGMRFFGHHGVSAAERDKGRWFTANLAIDLDQHRGFTSDRLADTVDYVELAAIVCRIGTGTRCRLVEHLAHQIVNEIMNIAGVSAVELTLEKEVDGLPGDPRSVGVRLTRRRDESRREQS